MVTGGQEYVDNEINEHPLSIYNCHSRTSTLPPIFRLPPELLTNIFIRCAADHHHDNNQRFLTRDIPSWVNVSYACHYWRKVALDCPTLWTYHFVASLRWTEELLARAKQAPLKIHLRFKFEYGKPDTWWLDPVEKLMSHTEQIQDLTLFFPDSDSLTRVLSMLSASAPRLENLRISASGFHSQQSFLPFHGNTPALRTLDISDCSIPWYSFKLSALTTLDLFHLPPRFLQNTMEFLATLRCMQELTEVYLDNALASAAGFLSSAAFDAFQKIDLPHLTRFLICAPLSTIITLLSCISIPLDAEVRLESVSEHDISLDHFALLPSALAQRFGGLEDQVLSGPTIRSLILNFTFTRWTTLVFSSWERDCDGFESTRAEGEYWDCNIPLEVVIGWPRSMSVNRDQIICDICRFIPPTNTQTLHVISPPLSLPFWRKTLGHLQDLRYIKLSQGSMPDLASVLSIDNLEGMENRVDNQDVFVPRLEELELHEISFSPGIVGLPSPAITHRGLVDALATRDVSQGRLTMTQCIIGETRISDVDGSWDDLVDTMSSRVSYIPIGGRNRRVV